MATDESKNGEMHRLIVAQRDLCWSIVLSTPSGQDAAVACLAIESLETLDDAIIADIGHGHLSAVKDVLRDQRLDASFAELTRLRWEMVLANERLMMFFANRHCKVRHHNFTPEDIKSEAKIGMLLAIDHFDPSRGAFSTCVGLWMRHHLDREIINCGTPIRVPVHYYCKSDIVKSESKKTAARQAMGAFKSLDAPLDEESDMTWLDMLTYPDQKPVDDNDEPLKNLLLRAMKKLDARERAIIMCMMSDRGNQSEIAKQLNVTRTTIASIEKKALANLKNALEELGLRQETT